MQKRNVEIVPLAASNLDAEADFYLVATGDPPGDARRGGSSLQRRFGQFAPEAVVCVQTARLDIYLANRCGPRAPLACASMLKAMPSK